MTQGIQYLINKNQAALDRVAFKLRIAALLEANYETLRSELSGMAADTPHQCLLVGAVLLNELRGLSTEFAGEKRRVISFFIKRSLKNTQA
ncbi:hypothetical protein N7V09_12325 [Shewanella seohaensis]|uniref:hypothetical protein n=1 Tax=Shewanella seohaensis TaxID=755175 RepID=UPI00200DD3EC|nr:hypothetical protein [Shewanella seohaensis]MCL1121208.1 hypothetical protein [Shewanella seohaensis]UXM80686.1 hypothetical protein N7V09_12325 [Shewanella seohaensis]